jgi:UDP-N-acetylenolpyruvoylglucosamine reductase
MTGRLDDLVKELRAGLTPETTIRLDEPLSRRTTLRVGGRADVYVEPASEPDLALVLQTCQRGAVPVFVLGRGSNLLVRDGGIRGVVIGLGYASFSHVAVSGDRIWCGGGARLKTVAIEARRAGLGGFEFLEGIPGSVGGALRMNAGAMGSWMFQVVRRVRMMDRDGTIEERLAEELRAVYRECAMLRTRIALGAELQGSLEPVAIIEERARGYNARRWSTQPAAASAGCVFKNPASVPAGRLIEELGLKGRRSGGAVISGMHGNFIVNEGGATAGDVLRLIDLVRDEARVRRGIELETELEIVGECG